jgi:predicted dehydrogenase
MGTHHAGAIVRSAGATISVVVDTDPMRAELLASTVSARASTRLEDAFEADAALVATPAASHLPIALMLFDAGVPLLVENPLSTRFDEALTIVRASGASGVPMASGLLERFNPVVQMARRLMQDEGPARHVVGLRHSAPEPVAGSDAVFDLLVHDIDLALQFLDGECTERPSGGVWPGSDAGAAEISDCTLVTSTGAAATLSATRLGQRKMAWMEVATEGQQMELDLVRRTMTVFGRAPSDPAGGSVRAPMIVDMASGHAAAEPLALQLEHFLALARGEIDPEAERRGLLAPLRAAAAVAASRAPRGVRARSSAEGPVREGVPAGVFAA